MSMIRFKIVTPEKIVFEDDIFQATLPIEGGEVTILPNHTPYIGTLQAGEIIVKKTADGEGESLATSGGFAEFRDGILTLLADTAERAEEIDVTRAEEAKARAELLMKERVSIDDEEYAKVAALLDKEFARVRVARKHRSRGGMSVGGQ